MDFMKYVGIALVLLGLFLVFGCTEPEWKTYSDEKFSMTYPEGDVQQTEGDEVFKVMTQGCQVSVSKFENQPSFDAFVTYIKSMWEDVNGLSLESEYIGGSVADFTVRATSEDVQYKGSIRIKGCDDDTIYVAMVGCGRDQYDNNRAMVDKIIDSVECS